MLRLRSLCSPRSRRSRRSRRAARTRSSRRPRAARRIVANCAGCHMPDLRGSNEARPLAGADFMRNWGERTTQDLVAFMSAAMPPPPASPGSLGGQTYLNLAAFLLAGERREAGLRRARRDDERRDRQRRDRRDAGGLQGGARDRGARGGGRRRGPHRAHAAGPYRGLQAGHGRGSARARGGRLVDDPRQAIAPGITASSIRSRATT